MVFYHTAEVVAHLEGFRNIDLFHQGLYKVRLDFRKVDPTNGTFVASDASGHFTSINLHKGCPFQTVPYPPSNRKVDLHHLVPASQDANAVTTQAFLIRY